MKCHRFYNTPKKINQTCSDISYLHAQTGNNETSNTTPCKVNYLLKLERQHRSKKLQWRSFQCSSLHRHVPEEIEYLNANYGEKLTGEQIISVLSHLLIGTETMHTLKLHHNRT